MGVPWLRPDLWQCLNPTIMLCMTFVAKIMG